MRKFKFNVIYVEDRKLKHLQVSSFSAPCACDYLQEMKSNAVVLAGGLGRINKEGYELLKQTLKEKNIID